MLCIEHLISSAYHAIEKHQTLKQLEDLNLKERDS